MPIVEPTIKLEHNDARGSIYSITLPDNKELMLLFSKAGVFRGGHSHDCDEIVVLLSGKMWYHKLVDGVEQITVLRAWDTSFNKAGEIHL